MSSKVNLSYSAEASVHGPQNDIGDDDTDSQNIAPPGTGTTIATTADFFRWVDDRILAASSSPYSHYPVRIGCQSSHLCKLAQTYVQSRIDRLANGVIFGSISTEAEFKNFSPEKYKIFFVIDTFVNLKSINNIEEILYYNDVDLNNKLERIYEKIRDTAVDRFGESENTENHLEDVMNIIKSEIVESILEKKIAKYNDPIDGYEVRKKEYNAFCKKLNGSQPEQGSEDYYTARDFLAEEWGHLQRNGTLTTKTINKHDPELMKKLRSYQDCISRSSKRRKNAVSLSIHEIIMDSKPSIRSNMYGPIGVN